MLCSPVLAQGVCDRTPQVRDALMDAAAVSNCAQVTPRHLSQVSLLNLETSGITTLKSHDFSGLSSVLDIWLRNNSLSELPEGLLNGLSSLKVLSLDRNSLTTLPKGIFTGLNNLTFLDLVGNSLTSLSEGVFSGLSSLEYLGLASNSLKHIPEGVFDGLNMLKWLWLTDNGLTALPTGVFDDVLDTLRALDIDSRLMARVGFSTATQSATKGTTVRVKVMLDRALPLTIRVPYRLGGTAKLEEFADLSPDPDKGLLFLAGETSREILFTLPDDGDRAEETVVLTLGELSQIQMQRSDGTGNHAPYLKAETVVVRLDEGAVHTVSVSSPDAVLGVCDRTPQVRAKLMEAAGASSCAQLTRGQLAAVSELDLSGTGIARLRAGDFLGLHSVTDLRLGRNPLTEIPGGIFTGLDSLKRLWLSYNFLNSLPEGIFDDVLDTLEDIHTDANLKATLTFESTAQEVMPGAHVRVRVQLSRSLPVTVRVPFSVGGSATADEYSGLSPDPDRGLLFLAGERSSEIEFTLSKTEESRSRSVVLRLGDLSRIRLRRSDGTGRDAPYLKSESLVLGPDEGAVHSVSIASPQDVLGVCDRTPQVRDKLMEAAGASSCAQLTRGQLAAVSDLDLSGTGITLLDADDFIGLNSLRVLWLNDNPLKELPAGIFDDVLDTLEDLRVDRHLKATLYFVPAAQETVEGATVALLVWLSRPLPVGVHVPFSVGGTAAADDFRDMAPSPDDGLLFKAQQELQDLTFSVSEGRDSLGKTIILRLGDLSQIGLRQSNGGPPNAPYLSPGSLLELDTDGVVHPVTVSFPNGPADICDRTPQVQDKLVEVTGASGCGAVTKARLASVVRLDLGYSGIEALQANDFNGLIGMKYLSLQHNSLSSLPEGVFRGLDSLWSLSLSDNSLTQLPERVFTGLDALRVLRLENNNLVSLPEDVFGDLSALEYLWLHYNSLSDLPEGVFSRLTNLEEVLLSDNRLSELPEGIFHGLGSLKRLWLFSDALTELPEGIFNGLSSLQELELKNNQLRTLPERVFRGLSNLELLTLGKNDLSSLPAEVFNNLNSLRILILQTNELRSLPEEIFRGLNSLEHLWLNVNHFTSLPEEIFTDLSSLRVLLLHSNDFEKLSPGIFSGLSSLVELTLHGNELKKLPDGVLKGLNRLKWLRLDYNELSDLPKGVFQGLDSLFFLRLGKNRLGDLPKGVFDDVLDTLNYLQVDADLKADLAFSLSAQRVEEGTTVRVPVVLSRPLPVAVRVPYALGIGAGAGGVTGLSPTPDGLLFAAGETRRDIIFTPSKDAGTQGEKTIVLSLGSESEIGVRRSEGTGSDAPYLKTSDLLSRADEGATHTVTVFDSDPKDQSPFCLSLWEGAPCSPVATLPHVLMGRIGESIAETEVVVTHKDFLPDDCEVALLLDRETNPATAVSFNGQFLDDNLLRTTIPRGGSEIVNLAAPDVGEPLTGALHVFTRSPCTENSLHVQSHSLLESQVDGEVEELLSVRSQLPNDWLGDGDCRFMTGVFGNGRDVVLAAVSPQPNRAAPTGTRLRLAAFNLKGNFIRQLPSLEISGTHQTWSKWPFDRPTIVQMCLQVPGNSSYRLAVSAIGITATGDKIQYVSESFPKDPDPDDASLDP